MDLYDFLDTNPQKVRPRAAGRGTEIHEVSAQYHGNVDLTDPSFNRHLGEPRR
jgi:cytochrome c peroxidase